MYFTEKQNMVYRSLSARIFSSTKKDRIKQKHNS